jgi:hydrogenase nickel incorporation protein HypA/HybF
VRTANGGGKVIAVEVRVGEWRQVVPEILSSYFEHLTEGTPLEGARIDIVQVAARARCRACGADFPLDDVFLVCPSCGSRQCELLSGRELELIGLELED